MERYDPTLAVLQEVADFLEGYSDVIDGDEGEPRPNKAMILLQQVEERIEVMSRSATVGKT